MDNLIRRALEANAQARSAMAMSGEGGEDGAAPEDGDASGAGAPALPPRGGGAAAGASLGRSPTGPTTASRRPVSGAPGGQATTAADIAALLRSRVAASATPYTSDDRIVLDLGSVYTKVGFAGEPAPRFIIPNRARPLDHSPGYHVQFWDAGFFEDRHAHMLQTYLVDHLTDVFFRALLTDPKGKTLVVCEQPLMPVPLKQTIAEVLFDRFRITALHFVPSQVMVMLSSGHSSGLVVDCGHLETTVSPVLDLRPMRTHVRSLPLAGEAVNHHLKDLLTKFGSLLKPVGGGDLEATIAAIEEELQAQPPGLSAYWQRWSNWALGLAAQHLGMTPYHPHLQHQADQLRLALAAGVGHGHTLIPWTPAVIEQLLTPEFLEQVKGRACFVGETPAADTWVNVTEPTPEELAAGSPVLMSPRSQSLMLGGVSRPGTHGSGGSTPASPTAATTGPASPRAPTRSGTHGASTPRLARQYRIYKSTATTLYYPLGERGLPVGHTRNMKLILPGWVRERAAEVLFDGLPGGDSEGIAHLVCETLLECNVDARAAASQRVLVVGGTAQLPGMPSRLRAEIRYLSRVERRYAPLRALADRMVVERPGRGQFPCGAWVGASLAAALKILGPSTETTSQHFEAWKRGEIPHLVSDWVLDPPER